MAELSEGTPGAGGNAANRASNRAVTDADEAADAAGRRDPGGGYNAGIAVFSYIIGGILVWSLVGFGLDNLLDTRWFVLAGAFVGAAGGFYLSYKHNLTKGHTPDSQSGSRRSPGAEDGPQ